MRNVAMFVTSILVTLPAHAGWEKFYESDAIAKYVDTAQVVKDDEGDGYRTAPLLTSFKKPDPAVPGRLSSVSLVEYDCKRKRSRELAYFAHSGRMADGSLVQAEPHVTRWMPMTTNPAFAPAMTRVCSL